MWYFGGPCSYCWGIVSNQNQQSIRNNDTLVFDTLFLSRHFSWLSLDPMSNILSEFWISGPDIWIKTILSRDYNQILNRKYALSTSQDQDRLGVDLESSKLFCFPLFITLLTDGLHCEFIWTFSILYYYKYKKYKLVPERTFCNEELENLDHDILQIRQLAHSFDQASTQKLGKYSRILSVVVKWQLKAVAFLKSVFVT